MIRWSARSGGSPNTGRGRQASSYTTAGSPRSITQSVAPLPGVCLDRQRCRMSSSPTNYIITPKLLEPRCRSRGAIRRHCFELGTGIGEPASRCSLKSRPARLPSRFSTCPAIPECSTSSPWGLFPSSCIGWIAIVLPRLNADLSSKPRYRVRLTSRRLNRQVLEKLGGRTRARTWDPMIKSLVLMMLFQCLSCKFGGFQLQRDQCVAGEL